MTEDEAIEWLRVRYPASVDALAHFVALLRDEAGRQNLVSASTLPHVWSRHIVDSAQLVALAPAGFRSWLDVGSGAGLPGMVIALLTDADVTMIEPRRLRVEFLRRVAAELDIAGRTTIIADKVENVAGAYDVISARAVMSVEALLEATATARRAGTRYILPKGASAVSDVTQARNRWSGTFHVEQSVVDAESGIVTVDGVTPR